MRDESLSKFWLGHSPTGPTGSAGPDVQSPYLASNARLLFSRFFHIFFSCYLNGQNNKINLLNSDSVTDYNGRSLDIC